MKKAFPIVLMAVGVVFLSYSIVHRIRPHRFPRAPGATSVTPITEFPCSPNCPYARSSSGRSRSC